MSDHQQHALPLSQAGIAPRHRVITRPAQVRPAEGLATVVDELCHNLAAGGMSILRGPDSLHLPSRQVVEEMIDALRSVLFPGYFGVTDLTSQSMQFHVGSTLDQVLRSMHEQVRRGLCFNCPQEHAPTCSDCEAQAIDITRLFLARLPHIQRLLASDVRAAYEGDPAATSPDETVFCYPGVLALTSYRLAHELYQLGVPLIPRMITEHAHSITGIDIHPGARVGEGLFIDHGTGVVVGETCEIGSRVRIYQGVTLGAKSFPLDDSGNPVKGIPRHPIVEDEVIIYSGATILGRVRIGRGTVIGGNVWLAHSVPPNSRITQAHVREVRYENGGGI